MLSLSASLRSITSLRRLRAEQAASISNRKKLLEVSIVPIPANPNALLVDLAEGNKGFGAIKLKEQVRRERELELIRLRSKPLTAREARELEVACMRSWR